LIYEGEFLGGNVSFFLSNSEFPKIVIDYTLQIPEDIKISGAIEFSYIPPNVKEMLLDVVTERYKMEAMNWKRKYGIRVH
jgi:hypothetical protein